MVTLVFVSSQNVNRLRLGEAAIVQSLYSPAYALAGLAYDTKFDFKAMVTLPCKSRYFKAPPRNPRGNSPKLGTLHATVMHAVEAAYRAAASR